MESNSEQKIALIVTTLCAFITPFMGSSVNIALPAIGREFHLDAVYLNWIASSFLLTTAALLLPAGRLADIYGRIKIFKIGVVIFAAGTLFCGVSFSGIFLIAARCIQGIGSALIFSTATAILVSSYPAEKRGQVLGINTAAVYSGLSTGPFFGGIITQSLGWRFIFFAALLLAAVLLILLVFKFKTEWIEAKGEKFDLKGAALYGIVLTAIMYGFSLLPHLPGVLLTTAGIAGFIIFIKFEMKTPKPVINIRLFAENKPYAFSNLAALINYCATFAVSFLLSFYLQYIKGFTPKDAGIILIAQPIVQALFSPVAGRLSDRIEPAIVSSIGMALTTAGLAILFFLSEQTGLLFIIISLIFLGFGFALFSSPNANAIMSSVEKKILRRGSFNTINNAADGTNVFDGDSNNNLFHLYRECGYYPAKSHRVINQHPCCICCFQPALFRRDFCFASKREDTSVKFYWGKP